MQVPTSKAKEWTETTRPQIGSDVCGPTFYSGRKESQTASSGCAYKIYIHPYSALHDFASCVNVIIYLYISYKSTLFYIYFICEQINIRIFT